MGRLGYIIVLTLGWIYIQVYALYILVEALWSAFRRKKWKGDEEGK